MTISRPRRDPAGRLHAIAMLASAAPRRILGVAVVFMVGAAVFGMPVVSSLAAGGFQDPTSESSRANGILRDTFGRGDTQIVFTVGDPAGADSAAARAAGLEVVDRLAGDPTVVSVVSPWSSRPQAAETLVSEDGRTAVVVADLLSGEADAPGMPRRSPMTSPPRSRPDTPG